MWCVSDQEKYHGCQGGVKNIITYLKKRHGEFIILWGNKHKYYGMDLEFLEQGRVEISMVKYTNKIINDFDKQLVHIATTPA